MNRLRFVAAMSIALVVATATPGAAAPTEVKVSDRAYVRHDGGTDTTIATCSVNNRQQNEPAATVAPHNTQLMSSGANDYCGVPTMGGTWAGFYYSANGGQTWANSLLPGYPTDTSAEGQASPLFGRVNNAGDPVQAWDNHSRLYYSGIAFNRARPAFGSIWVARYDWAAGPVPDYRYTTLVARGTPSPIFRGLFHDKVQLEVDRGADSPHDGNVYVCWARFTASAANNGVFFSRSTDQGRTFSNPIKISDSVHGSQFCDIAVTSNGAVYVAWRQYAFRPNQGQRQDNAVAWVKSTNGGRSFTKPRIAAEFTPWDPNDQASFPAAYGAAKHRACLAGDATLGACRSPKPRVTVGDCGDGPFTCESGYVFFRANTQVRISADPTEAGKPNEVFVVIDATVPGTETPTGTTYGTVDTGVGSQASIYFLKSTNGGGTWSAPSRIDAQAKGHQFFPDIVAEDGALHVVWQDSRADTASGPPTTPSGGDFRTVPISNDWVAASPPGSVSSGPGVESFYATSANGGGSWTTTEVSTVANMPQYEQFGDRDIPFYGDYNYIAASGDTVFMTWTDERDAVVGTDPRYTNGDGTDGFDVLQCRAAQPDGSFGPDTCPDAGGLDQNIYGAVLE
jgi:hypothetical protein